MKVKIGITLTSNEYTKGSREIQVQIEESIPYMESNWEDIVNYRDMYKAGYLIASSLVEKAADLVVAKRQKRNRGYTGPRWELIISALYVPSGSMEIGRNTGEIAEKNWFNAICQKEPDF